MRPCFPATDNFSNDCFQFLSGKLLQYQFLSSLPSHAAGEIVESRRGDPNSVVDIREIFPSERLPLHKLSLAIFENYDEWYD